MNVNARADRLFDELDAASPQPFAGSQVVGNLWLSRPVRDMFSVHHVSGQQFKITPGYVEFHEAFFAGVPLSQMPPTTFPPGTRLVLEIGLEWAVRAGTIAGALGAGPGRVYFKSGGYVLAAPLVRPYFPGEPLPVPFNDQRADLSTDVDLVNGISTFRFLLATIGQEAVDSAPDFGLAWLSTVTGPFGLALLFR